MKNKIIKEIKDRVKEGLNIHDLDLIDCISITNYLLNEGIINYWVEELSEDNDSYAYLCYYSNKLQKTIVFDNDFYQESDGESIELMAKSIWQMEQDIQDFESKISLIDKNMLTLNEFKNEIKIKDVEGNRRYLSVEINGLKYGQSYQNTVNTIENMINHFIVFYYPLYQSDFKDHQEALNLPY